MSVLKIPVWPEAGENIPMTFLHGEPGWYLWMLHKSAKDLSQIERDLMLLYSNGDLKDFPAELSPEFGIYVCTFSEDKIVRGLILNRCKDVSPEEGCVLLLDVDSGHVLSVQKNNLKLLPTFACKAPARAVRCDLGLDCKKRCDWPALLDEMLKRVLSDAHILVTFESERPGTIPTVSVCARLWDPNLNSAIDLRVWLAQQFRPVLEIASLTDYIPEPLSNDKPREPHNEAKPEETSGFATNLLPTNSWNSFNDPFVANSMLSLANQTPAFAPPPGFYPQGINPMTAFLLSQGFAYPQLPWTQMWPSFPANGYFGDMNLSSPPPPPQSLPHFGPQSLPQSLSSSQQSSFSSVPSSPLSQPLPSPLPRSLPSPLPGSSPSPLPQFRSQSASLTPSLPKVGNQNTWTTDNPEDRSSSPVLTIESLLGGSSTLSRKPMGKSVTTPMENEVTTPIGKEVTTPLTVDSLLGSPSNANSSPNPTRSTSGPKTTMSAKAATSIKRESNKLNHVVLQEEERDWPVGKVVHVIISYVVSPELFAANVVDIHATDFYRLQQEMSNFDGSLPLSVASKEEMFEIIGNFCATFDDNDDTWHRAEILNWFFDEPAKPLQAWSVDFGGMYEIPLTKIRKLEGYAAEAPMQATLFGMHNVRPRRQLFESEWPEEHCAEFRKILPVDKQFWLQIEKRANDAVWPVSIYKDHTCTPPSLNTVLVDRKLAFYHNSLPGPYQPSLKALTSPKDWDPMRDAYERSGHDYNYDDEDACIAVSGYKPRDEKNICRFFLERGSCPKGLNCRQRHVKMNHGDWTQEQEMVYTAAFSDLDLPEEGSSFTMRITKIVNVHNFFGVRIPDVVSSSEEHLKMLVARINSTEEVRKFEVCRSAPAFGQLVLARDSKGYWYRGRVIDVDHDCEERFEILDVDTGIMRGVELRNLREMNPAFLHLPFQAIECHLANVSPVKSRECSQEGCALVDRLVRSEMVKVFVVSRTLEDTLEVKVTVNHNGERQDLATILLRRGYAVAGPMRLPAPYKDIVKFRPG